MKYIKFRQKVINEHGIKVFHYWGIMDNGSFIAPIESANHTYWEALENSEKYTGLKDKNGRVIYEGDIVKATLPEWEGQYNDYTEERAEGLEERIILGEVQIRSKKGAGFAWRKDLESIDYAPNLKNKWFKIHSKTDEVIGNIYENPELLEAK